MIITAEPEAGVTHVTVGTPVVAVPLPTLAKTVEVAAINELVNVIV